MVLTSLHPSFGKNSVYILDCRACGETVCRRGMLAVLVADGRTELFSTDRYDRSSVGVIPDVFTTEKCKCRIQHLGCLSCGCVVGYHVVLPCSKCLNSVNNGHHCMFHSGLVQHYYRLDERGGGCLLWKQLVNPMDDDVPATECLR